MSMAALSILLLMLVVAVTSLVCSADTRPGIDDAPELWFGRR